MGDVLDQFQLSLFLAGIIFSYSSYLGNYSTEIHDLEPYTNYSVLVYCKNEAGIGKKEVKEKKYVVTDQLGELFFACY